jgi:uncharacterized protein YyaL (SSP411 family)
MSPGTLPKNRRPYNRPRAASIRRLFVDKPLVLILVGLFSLTGCKAQTPASGGHRLAGESSPYLRQHADNLVDWYPWGEEAFEKARTEDKPIFLSIGYSTCHWCHVMEDESFMDPKVADYLNQHFVSVKVDRETRPDVDDIYMTFVQRTTGSGGWPMTVFLNYDRVPFYGGTYFPNPPKYNRIGFLDLLKKVDKTWKQDRQALLEAAGKAAKELAAEAQTSTDAEFPPVTVAVNASLAMGRRFDPVHGGFLPAPKFPSPPKLDFLLRQAALDDDAQSKEMVLKTLRAMSLGGIRDHLEGGFHRYSTDSEWLVPHFEKMLYDQAQLLSLYAQSYAWTEDPLFRETAESILTYLEQSMRSPEGAYYSAEDADSALPWNPEEHAEGAFYVWGYSELEKALTPEELQICVDSFGVTKEGNATGDASGELDQMNVLARSKDQIGEPEKALVAKLTTLRDKRPRPKRDDKILTEWNALAAAGLADAGRYLKKPECLKDARTVLDFVEKSLVVEGELKRSYFEGRAEIDAFSADYFALVHAYLALYQATGEPADLLRATHWQERADRHFWDEADGGYFDTRQNTELPVRQKSLYDGATMGANTRAALNLSTLYQITGDQIYSDKLQSLLKVFAPKLESSPTASPGAMSALLSWYGSHESIIIVSQEASWWSAVSAEFAPGRVSMRVESEQQRVQLAKLIPFVPPWSAKSEAYRCQDFTCGLPVQSLAEVEAWLTKDVKRPR